MIELCWIGVGQLEESVIDYAREQVERQFRRPVARTTRPGRPAEAFDARRRQFSSSALIQWLGRESPGGAERVLGLTDEDLFIPILTYVFGEAQLNGRAAVVSTARLSVTGLLPAGLRAVLPGVDGERRILQARLAKECVHELGHTFGLLHCALSSCAMSRSATLPDVDAKGVDLCPSCRSRLRHAGPEPKE